MWYYDRSLCLNYCDFECIPAYLHPGQNIANNVQFGNKEMFMVCMNDFIAEKTAAMRSFLTSIVDRTTAELPTSAVHAMREQDFDLSEFEGRDLARFHKLFYTHAHTIASFFVEDGASAVEPTAQFMSNVLQVMRLVSGLGTPVTSPSSAPGSAPPSAAPAGGAPRMLSLCSHFTIRCVVTIPSGST